MYDAWDSWALAVPSPPVDLTPIVITMVTAQQATCLYILNVKYLQVLFCITFVCPFLFMSLLFSLKSSVCLVELFLSGCQNVQSGPPVQVCNIFECSMLVDSVVILKVFFLLF